MVGHQVLDRRGAELLGLEVGNLAESSYQLQGPTLEICTTYYWGVRAANAGGETGSTPYPASFGSEAIADFNGDGEINTLDFIRYLNLWSARDPSADVNLDDKIDTLDFLFYLNAYSAGC